jgi:hypothetical protein
MTSPVALLWRNCVSGVLCRHVAVANLEDVNSAERIADALAAATSLSESIDPLFRAVGGGASFGIAMVCAFEAMRKEPQWDRAAGVGAAGGALLGGALLLYDTIRDW